jgi:hypothetical protein
MHWQYVLLASNNSQTLDWCHLQVPGPLDTDGSLIDWLFLEQESTKGPATPAPGRAFTVLPLRHWLLAMTFIN